MNCIKKTLLILTVISAFAVSGCAKSSSSQTDSSAAGDSSAVKDSSSVSDSDSSFSGTPKQTVQGDKIKRAAAFFENENYEFVCDVKSAGSSARITLVKNKGIISQTTDYGDVKSCIVCNGDQTFRFDTLTKAYSKDIGAVTTDPTGNLIVQTVKKGLEPTSTHIDRKEAEKYDAEEYTYTGQTYITVLDFYFDKITGDLRKYTVTYSVEGRDNEVETREIVKMSDTAVSAVTFGERDLTKKNYTAYGAMTEEQKEAFCKKLMEDNKLTNEDLYAVGFTPFEFKTASYEELSAAFIAAVKNKK